MSGSGTWACRSPACATCCSPRSALAGLAGVFCSVMIYVDTRRRVLEPALDGLQVLHARRWCWGFRRPCSSRSWARRGPRRSQSPRSWRGSVAGSCRARGGRAGEAGRRGVGLDPPPRQEAHAAEADGAPAHRRAGSDGRERASSRAFSAGSCFRACSWPRSVRPASAWPSPAWSWGWSGGRAARRAARASPVLHRGGRAEDAGSDGAMSERDANDETLVERTPRSLIRQRDGQLTRELLLRSRPVRPGSGSREPACPTPPPA